MWLPYNEHYSVSSEGEIRSDRYNRILKPFRIGNYDGVRLGAKTKRYVHHLVAEVFCPKIDTEGLEIDHMNRDKKDNRAENLRWTNHSDNMKNRSDYIRPAHFRTYYGKQVLVKEHRVVSNAV